MLFELFLVVGIALMLASLVLWFIVMMEDNPVTLWALILTFLIGGSCLVLALIFSRIPIPIIPQG